MIWDIFCQVIDNYGDAGVCWRLAYQLAQRGERVRLWMNDVSMLSWMAPTPQLISLEVGTWDESFECQQPLPDVIIEAFGCEIPQEYLHSLRSQWTGKKAIQPVWLNLEYLSAEPYVERMHGLPSPVMTGLGRGWCKHFFYPGFTTKTGGLLCEQNLPALQHTWNTQQWRDRLLVQAGLSPSSAQESQWLSLFSYEAVALTEWLDCLVEGTENTVLLVAAGRSQRAFENIWLKRYGLVAEARPVNAHDGTASAVRVVRQGRCTALLLPFMSQVVFDELLWSSDLNIVRGEDSLVRALWAGKPFIWHIYPQHDQAHHVKLDAFLDWMDAPSDLRQLFHGWNAMKEYQAFDRIWMDAWNGPEQRKSWQELVQMRRVRLWQQNDLVSQLQLCAQRLAESPSHTN